jgi:hypothetical protein
MRFVVLQEACLAELRKVPAAKRALDGVSDDRSRAIHQAQIASRIRRTIVSVMVRLFVNADA